MTADKNEAEVQVWRCVHAAKRRRVRGLTGVEGGLVAQRLRRRLHEGGHEPQFDVVLLQEGVFMQRPHLLDVAGDNASFSSGSVGARAGDTNPEEASPHVHFVERGQHGAGVLSLLQPLGDPQPHALHLHLQKTVKQKPPPSS